MDDEAKLCKGVLILVEMHTNIAMGMTYHLTTCYVDPPFDTGSGKIKNSATRCMELEDASSECFELSLFRLPLSLSSV